MLKEDHRRLGSLTVPWVAVFVCGPLTMEILHSCIMYAPPRYDIDKSWQRKATISRYWCIRMLSCPLPGLKSSFPIIGGRTLIEVVCVIFLFSIGIALALPDFHNAGKISDYFGAVTTILGLRNNILNIVLGISYERAIFWHKIMGFATIAIIIIHSLNGFSITGLIMIVSIGFMVLTYFIKDLKLSKSFEIFYYTHLTGIFIIIVVGQLHSSAFWFSIACMIWTLDICMRCIVSSKIIKAKAIVLPGKVVELRFESQVAYNAGQYAFIRIPEVNAIEFHPFSFSSAPHEGTMTMHIREIGDWTRRLGDLVRQQNSSQSLQEGISLDVMIDGPYGKTQVDFYNLQYEVFLLISGGIGITPNQSLYKTLSDQATKGRNLRKVFFIWSVKDRALVDSIVLPLSYTPTSFQPPLLEKMFDDTNNLFENRFYLTQVRQPENFVNANINLKDQPWLYFGRPNIAALFEETRTMLKEDQRRLGSLTVPRVAVFVCGPLTMVHEVKDECHLSQLSCSEIIFDCHTEIFQF